mmetsp:Transcript_32447/g.103467  ORF Transcript_32447/g.103467 Transcript_32447/m.103467 type:complete len:209 (-) Transcript_32447:212-838(-)
MGCASSTPGGEASAPAPRLSQREREQKKPSTCGSLVWNDVAQGTLQLVWTENDPVEGALAFFETEAKVPAFKLTQNCGRSDIMKGLGGPNNTKFYQAWTQFIKVAQAWPGEFTHVLNMDAKPLAIYTTTEAIKVSRITRGEAVDLSQVTCVAIVPEASGAYQGVTSLELGMFKQNCKSGGGVVLDLVSSARSSAPPSPVHSSPVPAAA